MTSVLRPGRLVIVDLRDELVEKDEALGLFVVSPADVRRAVYNGRQFNKLVVFDEAHKYIDNPDLVAGPVEVVREMFVAATSTPRLGPFFSTATRAVSTGKSQADIRPERKPTLQPAITSTSAATVRARRMPTSAGCDPKVSCHRNGIPQRPRY